MVMIGIALLGTAGKYGISSPEMEVQQAQQLASLRGFLQDRSFNPTEEARKIEYCHPLTPKQKKEGIQHQSSRVCGACTSRFRVRVLQRVPVTNFWESGKEDTTVKAKHISDRNTMELRAHFMQHSCRCLVESLLPNSHGFC